MGGACEVEGVGGEGLRPTHILHLELRVSSLMVWLSPRKISLERALLEIKLRCINNGLEKIRVIRAHARLKKIYSGLFCKVLISKRDLVCQPFQHLYIFSDEWRDVTFYSFYK